MQRPVNAVHEIIVGKKAITPRTALELERELEIPAHIWVRLEADYRLALERQKTGSIDKLSHSKYNNSVEFGWD